jgi:hypothetical protein
MCRALLNLERFQHLYICTSKCFGSKQTMIKKPKSLPKAYFPLYVFWFCKYRTDLQLHGLSALWSLMREPVALFPELSWPTGTFTIHIGSLLFKFMLNNVCLHPKTYCKMLQLYLCLNWKWALLMLCWYNQTLWPESVSELYLPSDRHLSANLVPAFVDRGCRGSCRYNTYLMYKMYVCM